MAVLLFFAAIRLVAYIIELPFRYVYSEYKAFCGPGDASEERTPRAHNLVYNSKLNMFTTKTTECVEPKHQETWVKDPYKNTLVVPMPGEVTPGACSYCLGMIKEHVKTLWVCPVCETYMHNECYLEIGKCSTYGCRQ